MDANKHQRFVYTSKTFMNFNTMFFFYRELVANAQKVKSLEMMVLHVKTSTNVTHQAYARKLAQI